MICLVWAWEGPTVSSTLLHSYFSYFPWLCGILHSQSHVLSIILGCSYVLHFFFFFFVSLCPCSFVLFIGIHLIWRYQLHYQAICVFSYLLCLFCTATKSPLTDWVMISCPTSTAGAGISHLVHTGCEPVFFKYLGVGKGIEPESETGLHFTTVVLIRHSSSWSTTLVRSEISLPLLDLQYYCELFYWYAWSPEDKSYFFPRQWHSDFDIYCSKWNVHWFTDWWEICYRYSRSLEDQCKLFTLTFLLNP